MLLSKMLKIGFSSAQQRAGFGGGVVNIWMRRRFAASRAIMRGANGAMAFQRGEHIDISKRVTCVGGGATEKLAAC